MTFITANLTRNQRLQYEQILFNMNNPTECNDERTREIFKIYDDKADVELKGISGLFKFLYFSEKPFFHSSTFLQFLFPSSPPI